MMNYKRTVFFFVACALTAHFAQEIPDSEVRAAVA